MLDDLDKVDWGELQHAYGPATDVPGLVRKLASPNEQDREKAICEFYGNIWHQGTVYKATAYVVPFLIELLTAEEVQDKHAILFLLAHLATGNSYKDVHRHLPLFQKLYGEEMATAKWQAELEEELSWVRKATETVRSGKATYLRSLSSPEGSERDAAGYILAILGGPAADVSDHLVQRLEVESDETAKAGFLLAYARVCEHRQSGRGVIEKFLRPEEPLAVRLAAAMSLVAICSNQSDSAVVSVLLAAIQSPKDYSALEKSCWANGETVVSLVSRYLRGVEGEAAAAAEAALVGALSSQKLLQAITIVEVLLSLAFKAPVDRAIPFGSLDERQQRLLKVLASNRNVWGVQSGKDFIEDVHASNLMRSYGLPDRYVTVQAYVRGQSSANVPPSAAVQSGNMIARVKRFFKK